MLNECSSLVSWRTRPRSFTGLMTLYESNFHRLGWLGLDPLHLPDLSRSRIDDDLPLELRVIERCRYTTVANLSYVFTTGLLPEREPGLEMRVYHDARLVEVSDLGRDPCVPQAVRVRVPTSLDQRWARNMLLNKWLDYCFERGHGFAGRPARVRPSAATA
ncbi:MAG: DUF1249 domain-containing protein [Steroidobacteraceae bacterium]